MKKFLLALMLLLVTCDAQAQIRTTVASDNFNRADEDPLSNGGLWRTVGIASLPGFELISNRAHPNLAGDPDIHWMIHTTALNNDQWSEVLCDVVTSGYCGLVLRWAASGTETGYFAFAPQNGDGLLFKVVAGSSTQLDSQSGLTVQGGTWRLHAVGTALTLYVDDVSQMTATDAAIASGSAGIMGYANSDQLEDGLENFAMGNFSAGGGGLGRGRRVVVE